MYSDFGSLHDSVLNKLEEFKKANPAMTQGANVTFKTIGPSAWCGVLGRGCICIFVKQARESCVSACRVLCKSSRSRPSFERPEHVCVCVCRACFHAALWVAPGDDWQCMLPRHAIWNGALLVLTPECH
jgi:hypothetical protein